MKAYIKNFGCQMNTQDSLHMGGLLTKMGWQTSDDITDSNLILLVTCSIREKAVHKVYSELGRIRLLMEDNPDLMVGVSGCVAQQEKGNLFKRFPFLDLVFGPDAIKDLPTMITQAQQTRSQGRKNQILKTKFDKKKDFEFVNLLVDRDENKVSSFVNIQKGCDNVCSFCIVPRVRGPEVSRPSQQIVDEVKALVDMGVKEVTLLGQNVNSYGLKDDNEITFAQLLTRVATETGIKRLRFTTSHPKDVGPDLFEAYEKLEALCPHFHLPVQSGSNPILKAMRRQYTREHYLSVVSQLQKARPDIRFSTDIIIGFPGETEDDFKETLSLMDEVGFDSSYSFVYSQRPGTTALRLEDGVDLDTKNKRLALLQDKQRQISAQKNKPLENTKQEVLIEKYSDTGNGWVGRTATNKIVHMGLPSNISVDKYPHLIGQLQNVHITKANPHSLVGELAL